MGPETCASSAPLLEAKGDPTAMQPAAADPSHRARVIFHEVNAGLGRHLRTSIVEVHRHTYTKISATEQRNPGTTGSPSRVARSPRRTGSSPGR